MRGNVQKLLVPPLRSSLHKGQMGRIGVIGGSLEYTGAPYFAAMTALRVGCDIAHVFTTEEAAPSIKSYSPELIVHPSFIRGETAEHAVNSVSPWLPSLHALVVGPGLGRDPHILSCVQQIIKVAMSRSLPIIVDGDGLFLALNAPDLMRGYSKAVFSPNLVEWKRFLDAGETAASLGVTIVQKGSVDVFHIDGEERSSCDTRGSPRRSGGQGDLLSGALAAFSVWANEAGSHVDAHLPLWAACDLVRRAAHSAFQERGRATLASDVLRHIGPAFRVYDETQ